jgi:TIR domain
VSPRVLFAKYNVFNVVEDRKTELKASYVGLPDDTAVDENVTQQLKARFMLNVPVLKASEMSYEEHRKQIDARKLPNRVFFPGTGLVMEDATELIIHIPFDGDASVFDIAPSAYNGQAVQGDVVGQELLLRLTVVDSNYDIQGHIDRELRQINWALTHLREKETYFSQELGVVLAHAVANRKRAIESRSNIAGRLKIPQKQSNPQEILNLVDSTQTAISESSTLKGRDEKWDVFISHASEDKTYVEPLVKALEAAGVSVWYDRLVLEWGDDLRSKIDNGLINCRYGIVVLSKAFLGKKKWTEHELNGLFAREEAGKKLVLPIWHGITRKDLLQYSPALADRLAKISGSDSYQEIVGSLLSMLGRSVPKQIKAQVPSGTGSVMPSQKVSSTQKAPDRSYTDEDLSPREIELLWTAEKDPGGEILHSKTLDGEGIRSNGRHFLKDADARTAAEWLEALRGLENRGFIEPLSDERTFFRVTGRGYDAASLLEDFARWSAESIVLRAHYVKGPSDECALACKGVIAIPARYFADQESADGQIMRSLKERRSLLVEGVSPKPTFNWTPNEVGFVDTMNNQIERFRVDGMQLVSSTRLKLPIVG